jgi:phage terminase small subunit
VAKLTPKQERFIAEYLIDLNATQAAIRAGYSPKTAHVIGQENLRKPAVQIALQAKRQKIEQSTEITIERVLKEFARLGFQDPRKLFNDDGSPKGIHELDDDTAAAIAGLDVMEIYEGSGKDRQFVGYLKKYRLADKKGALDSIGKHLGMFVDKKEIAGELKISYEDVLSEIEEQKGD